MNDQIISTPELSGRVLIVDDDALNLQVLTTMLSRSGCQVTSAVDGTSALASASANPPDLILLDILLPDLDGYEVCRQLKQNDLSRDIPVIFISSLDDSAAKLKGFGVGGVDFITKPFRKLEVLMRAQSHLSLHRLRINLETQNKLLQQEIAERHQIERHLEQARAELELRVETRTSDLKRANDRLSHEVSEHLRTSEALRHSAEQTQLLLNSTTEGIYGMDLEGKCTFSNSACLTLLGYHHLSELLGDSFHRLVQPPGESLQNRSLTLEHLIEAANNGKNVHYDDGVFYRKDGSSFQAEYWCNPIERDGKTIGTVLGFLDITERRKTETSLRLLSMAIQQSDQLIMITDSQGLIEYVNPAFERATGYRLKEAHGKKPAILKSGKHTLEFYQELWKTLLQGEVFQCQFINRKKNGDLYPEEKVITAIKNPRDEITHFLSIGRDVSVRLKLEEELRQLQKLESIGRLASGVAHDFNNLLASIRLSGEVLTEDNLDQNARLEVAKEIADAVERGSALTRQMLAFARKQPVTLEPLDLGAVVENMTQMLRRLLKKGISVSVDVPDSLPAIDGDKGMIEQIVLNLAVNARDAMNEEGKLRFALKLIDVSPNTTLPHPEASVGQFIRLTASDTGTGIPPEVIPHLFEPFFTTKESGHGTGLGLSMVYGIIKQHGGWIQVESQLGHGTSFHLFLKVSERAIRPATHELPPVQLRGNQELILVVDDNSLVREALRRFLTRNGYLALEADSGAAALEIWRTDAPRIDLLFTDMQMPGGISGGDLARRLMTEKPSLKAILTSGFSEEINRGDFDDEDRVQLIRKPSPPKTILKAVHKALGAGQKQQTVVPNAVTTAATASIQPNQTNSLAQ